MQCRVFKFLRIRFEQQPPPKKTLSYDKKKRANLINFNKLFFLSKKKSLYVKQSTFITEGKTVNSQIPLTDKQKMVKTRDRKKAWMN